MSDILPGRTKGIGVSGGIDTWAAATTHDHPPPSAFVQWKGTDVCLDFYCSCGYAGHYDGSFAYGLRCAGCGQAWRVPSAFGLVMEPENHAAICDTDLPHVERPITNVDFAEVVDDD